LSLAVHQEFGFEHGNIGDRSHAYIKGETKVLKFIIRRQNAELHLILGICRRLSRFGFW